VYKIVRLKNSIVVIRKYYSICASRFKGILIKNPELHTDFLRVMIQAFLRLFDSLRAQNIKHGNIKLQNCFFRIIQTHEGQQLKIILSDPYLDMNFEPPRSDQHAIGEILHTLVCGRPPAVMMMGDESTLYH
jgi:LytS/YehU family sensor histidine kinase